MRLPLRFPFLRSLSAAAVLSLLHFLAVAILLAVELPVSVKLLFVVLLAVSGYRSISDHALRRGRNAVVGIMLRDKDQIELEYADGWSVMAALDATSTVFPFLVMLNVRLEGRRLTLPLPADSMKDPDYRHLRMWLRWRVGDSSGTFQAVE